MDRPEWAILPGDPEADLADARISDRPDWARLPEDDGRPDWARLPGDDEASFENRDSMPYEQRQGLFGAGMDSFWGLAQSGIGKVAGMVDQPELSARLLESSDINMAAANAVPRDGIVDDVIFAAGQAVPAIGVGIAGAVAAPFVGLKSIAGAGIFGFAASWGVNVGDFLNKQLEEDPDYEPTLGDLATPTLMAGFDLAPGVGPLARSLKILKPLGDAVADSVVDTAVKAGAKVTLGKFGTEVSKAAAGSAVVEAAQDLTGSIGAVLTTGNELTPEKLDSFARAAAYEGLIGGILGVPLGGASFASNQLVEAQVRFDENYVAPEFVQMQGEDGQLSEQFRNLQLVDGAASQPGMINMAFTTVFGNATDSLKQKYADSPKMMALLENFTINRRDRGPDKFTINESAKGKEGELQTAAKIFNQASSAVRRAAYKNKSEGLAPANDVESALSFVLDEQIPDMYNRATRWLGREDGLLTDPTYLPTHLMMDYRKMEDTPSYLETARLDMVENGKSDLQIFNTLSVLQTQVESFKATGDPLHASKAATITKSQIGWTESIQEVVDKSRGKGLNKKLRNRIKNQLLNERKTTTRQGALTLDRSLGNLSQKWLTSFFKDEDPKASFNAHIRAVSEQTALIDRFGLDNTLFDEAVIDIALDQAVEGNPLDASDVDRLYDILRTQQRLHLRPLKSEKVRTIQNNVRAGINVNLLGLSALVSIPESLTIFMNTGGKAALQGLLQTLRLTPQTRLASEQLGYTINGAINHTINRTGEESFEVKNWESAFIRWTGLPYLQHFLTVWSARANDVHIRDMLAEMQAGVSPTKLTYLNRKLAEAGLDSEKALLWAESGFPMDSDFFEDTYIPAVVSLTHDTIVDPHPIDKPLWMNDERFALVAQLKGFMTVFTNRVMRDWKDKVAGSPEGNIQLATKVAPYVAMYIAAQIGAQAAREMIKSGDLDNWDEKEISTRIGDSFAYLGGMSYFIDTYRALQWRGDPLASALGPFASITMRLAGSTVQGIENSDPEAILDAFFKQAIPNLPGKSVALELITEE